MSTYNPGMPQGENRTIKKQLLFSVSVTSVKHSRMGIEPAPHLMKLINRTGWVLKI